ncbi:MAG: RNA polymerase sporulation sigma factor SigK [Bacilli bacterium]|nr:RNA polymerase sporulation sigma factor SigK [Bacilli bacterium]
MFLLSLLQNFFFLTGSYSNTIFPEPLSPKEEALALHKMKLGDKNARNKLIEHNLRLVAHIVKKFEGHTSDTDDLISIGTIGLIKGVDSYNHDKNIKLTTYIAKCIQNEILMYFRSIKGENIKSISLNDSIGHDKDGNEISLIEVIKDNSEDFQSILQRKENLEQVSKYMNTLSYREKEILCKRYGLLNQKEQTQKEIAKEMHISRSYVSRIEKRALTKILKEFMKNKKA